MTPEASSPHKAGSMFRYSLFLALGSAAALAAASLAVVLFSPPPFFFPLSSLEVARLLRGQPIAHQQVELVRERVSTVPAAGTQSLRYSLLVRDALARQLGVPAGDVWFELLAEDGVFPSPALSIAQSEYQRMMVRGESLYGDDPRFAPLVFGAFRVGVREQDGRWTMATWRGPSPGPNWQVSAMAWIGLALVLIVPIAWLVSRRLAGPIGSFAEAADRVGRGSFEHLPEAGPAEIRKAAAAINGMQARMERHVQERTAVVGAIAHDLRAPLSRLGFLVTAAPPAIRAKIEIEVARMERMVSVALEFVHSETATPQREVLDLRLLIEGVVDDVSDMGRDATVEPGSTMLVVGDAMLLTRLFANLVTNALTYGRCARVRAYVEADSANGEWAVVDVADSGPGLSDADLERVFEPYYRVESSRSAVTGGMGLGLAIVRSLARAHGGTVSLHNRREGGLVARVRLPMAVGGGAFVGIGQGAAV